MSVQKFLFGELDGQKIYRYEVETEYLKAEFCEMGACLMALKVKDREGLERDIVLGVDKPEYFLHNWQAFGAVIGRCANRIHRAKFELNGKKYKLEKNIAGGCLHSGRSYHYRKWESHCFEDQEGIHVVFQLESPHMDQGFPGNLTVKAEYLLSSKEVLTIRYEAVSDRDTIVNLTNHSYFNLSGHDYGCIFDHRLMIHSDFVTQTDRKLMPTGKLLPVDGSAFDFRQMTVIRENRKKKFKPYCHLKEYDINYVLADSGGCLRKVAVLESEESGIGMNVYTDLPGMQLYTANAVGRSCGKGNIRYAENPGICFETQYFPDAINQENFESPVLKAGVRKMSVTEFEFYRF